MLPSLPHSSLRTRTQSRTYVAIRDTTARCDGIAGEQPRDRDGASPSQPKTRSPFKTVILAVPVSTTTWTHPEMTWPYGAKLSGVASITGRCRVSCTPTERQEVSRGIEQKLVLRVGFPPWLGRYSTHRVVVVRTVLHRWIHLSHATTETHIRENLQPHLYIAIKIDRTRGVGTHVHKHR